jgi:hypothetical protein
MRRVLILGLDPDAIPGIDAAGVRAGLEYGLARFEGSDLIAEQCLVPLDATAERRIVEALGENNMTVSSSAAASVSQDRCWNSSRP